MAEASPRFRKDLIAQAIEVDGVACVDVHDPATGSKFRLYDFEYELAQQLTGRPLAEVTAWASANYGVELTTEGVGEFAGRLAELGFLERDDERAPAEVPVTRTEEPTREAAPTSARPAEALEDAEAEWNVEAARTARFEPDPSMLDSLPLDLTPVAQDLPDEGIPRPRPRAASASTSTSAATEAAKTEERPVPRWVEGLSAELPLTPASFGTDGDGTTPSGRPDPSLSETASVPMGMTMPSPVGGSPGAPATASAARTPIPSAPLEPPPAAPVLGRPPSGSPGEPGAPSPSPRQADVAAQPWERSAERRQPPAPEAVVMAPFGEDAAIGRRPAAAPASQRRPAIVAGVMLVVLVVAVVAYLLWSYQRVPQPQAIRVRVLSPKPTTVYRWFSGPGRVLDPETAALAFTAGGRLAELVPPGTEVAAGEIVGRLQGANAVETALSRHRARVAYYRQMRESMAAAGNQPEQRQAEARLAEKQRLVAETETELERLTLRATEPAVVLESLAKVGTVVKPGSPMLRVRSKVLRGEFAFEKDEEAEATKLGFCRAEVIGLGPRAANESPRRERPGAIPDSAPADAQSVPGFVDCRVATDSGAASNRSFRVVLPGDVGLVPSQPLRLARRRIDGVFPVPRSAIGATSGEADAATLWVAGAGGRAEHRAVVVAENTPDAALVQGGLAVGEEVIAEPPAGLTDRALLAILR